MPTRPRTHRGFLGGAPRAPHHAGGVLRSPLQSWSSAPQPQSRGGGGGLRLNQAQPMVETAGAWRAQGRASAAALRGGLPRRRGSHPGWGSGRLELPRHRGRGGGHNTTRHSAGRSLRVCPAAVQTRGPPGTAQRPPGAALPPGKRPPPPAATPRRHLGTPAPGPCSRAHRVVPTPRSCAHGRGGGGTGSPPELLPTPPGCRSAPGGSPRPGPAPPAVLGAAGAPCVRRRGGGGGTRCRGRGSRGGCHGNGPPSRRRE